MIKIKSKGVNEKMLNEVLKDDDISSFINSDVGRKRHQKLIRYLVNQRNDLPIKHWLREKIDELPD